MKGLTAMNKKELERLGTAMHVKHGIYQGMLYGYMVSGKATKDQYEKARREYDTACNAYQIARRDYGLCYVLSKKD